MTGIPIARMLPNRDFCPPSDDVSGGAEQHGARLEGEDPAQQVAGLGVAARRS